MSACGTLRHVLVGGEALPPALAARFKQRLPHTHLHNAYGPTETTVDATGDSAWVAEHYSRVERATSQVCDPLHQRRL